MPKISIIVPVYNVERYLKKCVDCILAQTYADFELILVDDGSPDRCGLICEEYKKVDERVRVIHKENGGLSSARNAGMDIAKGEFYLFCDSDDYVAPEWCEHFIENVKPEKDNYIFGGIVTARIQAGITTLDESNTLVLKRTYPVSDFLKLQVKSQIGFAWNVLYYADVIRQHGLRFSADVIIEDLPFNLEYLKYMKELTGTGIADYYYIQDERVTLSKKYYPNNFRRWQEKYQITMDYSESQISNDQKEEFRRIVSTNYLYPFLQSLDNTFDHRNMQSFRQKLQYNDSVVKSKAFQSCLKYADISKEDARYIMLLRRKQYLFAYLLQRLAHLKNMIKGEKQE